MNIKRLTTLLLCVSLTIAPIFVFADSETQAYDYAEQTEVESIDAAISVSTIDLSNEAKVEEDGATENKKVHSKEQIKTVAKAKSKTDLTTVKKTLPPKKETVAPLSKNANKMVYYLMKKNPSLSKATATKIYNSVMKHSSRYRVDPYLVFAVMEQESRFNPNTSYSGAYGLMQLYHSTLPYLGITMGEVYDIDKNIRAGVYELSGNFKMFGNTVTALSAYNAGSGNVKRGNYNTRYANSVIRRKNNIVNYMN